MRILFISATIPYPLDTGSRNLIYHWLEAASRIHHVDLFLTIDQSIPQPRIPGLPNVGVHSCPIHVSRALLSRVLRQAACFVRGVPATSLILLASEIQRRVADLVKEDRYDLVVLPENVVAGFARILFPTVPVLLVKHSVQAVDAADQRRRQGRHHPRSILEERVVKRFEADSCRAATVVCCVTRKDADQLVKRYSLSNPVENIPIGVDLTQFPRRSNDPNTKLIGFFGNLTWGANVDAVRWFCHEVLPRVWQTHPDAGFLVIGPGGDQLRSLCEDARVRFLGRVSSIPESMREVSIGVTPVISGTGIRFKLLEMLSMGIPSVSTPLGVEGTDCVDGKHLLIADTADAFARSIDTLLHDAALRQRLAASGAKLAASYSWAKIYPKILDLFEFTCRQHRRAA